jgi:hypothetical protein
VQDVCHDENLNGIEISHSGEEEIDDFNVSGEFDEIQRKSITETIGKYLYLMIMN